MKTEIICDAGSTKSQWAVISNGACIYQTEDVGLNPFLSKDFDIIHFLKNALDNLNIQKESINALHFYGAGCNELQSTRIKELWEPQLSNITEIYITSDIYAAIKALYLPSSEGIAGILGTGSNFIYQKNHQIIDQIPSLGLYLGDEGSGGYMGKLLVKSWLRNQLNTHLEQSLEAHLKSNKETFIQKIYKEPYPNRFLAALTKFIKTNENSDEIQNIINENFKDLYLQCIAPLQQKHVQKNIRIVGSIGYYFEEHLKTTLAPKGIQLELILQKPIDNLIKYHLNRQIK